MEFALHVAVKDEGSIGAFHVVLGKNYVGAVVEWGSDLHVDLICMLPFGPVGTCTVPPDGLQGSALLLLAVTSGSAAV